MDRPEDGLYAALTKRGLTRRAFLKFGVAITATLALPATYAPQITRAIERAPRLPVIWLRGQACGGDSEAFLAAADPSVSELLLELLSVDYHEVLMGASGEAATAARQGLAERYPNGYLAVVEGAIPTAGDGMACAIGGRPFRDVVREVCDGALVSIAIGACAVDGGAAAASGGATGAVGVGNVVSSDRLVNLPGCPINVENVTATIVHYLTFDELPPVDWRRRPYFAYGGLVHNQCERRAHFEFGEFVLSWGDEGAQKGWCLYKLGCKGPETFANCPTVQYASGTSWNVKAGQGCIGCTMPGFWDAMGPAHARLPSPIPFAPNVSSDQIGLALVGGVAALTAAHGTATYARELRNKVLLRRRAARTGRSGGAAMPATADGTPEGTPEGTSASSEPAAGPGVSPEAAVAAREPDPDGISEPEASLAAVGIPNAAGIPESPAESER